MAGDIVKRIYVPIKVQGAEEAKTQMAEISAMANKLGDGVTIHVKVDKDGLNAIDSLFTRIWSQIGKFKLPLPGPLPTLTGPTGIAAVIAALASLPFIAQAAAGAIVLGLGGALTALGVYAEMGTRSVKYQFSQLVSGKDGIAATFKNLSPLFGQALTTILSAARTFVPQFIRDFKPALDAIAGPLKSLGVMIAGTLASPQIRTSIVEMGKAFGSILKALTPMVPGMFTAIADGFTNVARAISRNPKPIADLIAGLAHLIGILLDVIAWLTNVASYIEQHWIPAWQRTVRFLDSWRHAIAANFEGMYHDTLAIFNRVKTDIANIWSSAWNNTVGVTVRGIRGVMAQVRAIPGQINSALAGLPGDLFRAGAAAMDGLISGIQSKIGSVISTVSNIAGWIKAHFPFSPAKVGPLSGTGDMYYAGRSIARGLAAGMEAGRVDVTAATMRLAGVNPGGVMAYGGTWPGGVLRLEVVGGGGGALDRLFISWLKNYVRVAGGGGPTSVQRALGQVWR